MKAYVTHLDLAHASSGGSGYVQIGHLAQEFNTPVWASLKDKKSKFVSFLTNNFGTDDGIMYDSLVIMGLLYC